MLHVPRGSRPTQERNGRGDDRRLLEFTVFAALPIVLTALAVYSLSFSVPVGWHRVIDFHGFWEGGRAYLRGGPLYPPIDAIKHQGQYFMYPAPMAAILAPLAFLPFAVAATIWLLAATASVLLAIWVLDVRDWRCFGAAFLWPSVLPAIKIGTLTPFLVLGIALLWRYRNHVWRASILTSLIIVAKLFLWPVLIWLLVTGRIRASIRAVALMVVASLVAWLPLGIHSLVSYSHLLHKLSLAEGPHSYQPAWLGPGPASLHLVALEAASAVAAALFFWFGRRLTDARCLSTAIVIALACSPIVWSHYLALLLPVVALAHKRLSPAWLAPIALWATSQQFADRVTWRVILVVAVAAIVWLLSREEPRRVSEHHAAGLEPPVVS